MPMGSLNPRTSVLCLVVALALSVSCSLFHREPEAPPAEGEAAPAAPAEAQVPKEKPPKVPQKQVCQERVAAGFEGFEANVTAAVTAIQQAPDIEECKPVGPDGTLDVKTKDTFAEMFRASADLQRICFETKCHIVVISRAHEEYLKAEIFLWNGAIQPWESSRPGIELRQTPAGDHYFFAKQFYLIGPAAKQFGGFMALEFSCGADGLDFPWGDDPLAIYDKGYIPDDNLVSSERISLVE